MKDFLDNNLNKLLGSAGFLGVIQFMSHLNDYLADGKLDDHEIQNLLLSTGSAAQTLIILIIIAYFKFFKNNKE